MDKVMFSSRSDEWSTPDDLFDKLNRLYHFDLDPCATDNNTKCENYYTKEQDGLVQSWKGARVFCNPPYGREVGKWVRKCSTEDTEICVMLLPARTDTKWFHEYIYNKAEIIFLKGRLKFGQSENSAPFPSMVVIFKKGGF